MAGFLGEEQIRKVKAAVDLVQVFAEYAPLRKAGRNWSCCCPFHQERSPSCYIYPEQQTYHCFGCGAHGDLITLVREKERLEFSEAVELLARRAGITLEYQSGGDGRPKGERDALIAAMAFAVQFYEKALWESPGAAEAREYLNRRRLSRAVCERFRLGWSPGGGQLVDAARRKSIPPALLATIDLAVERNGRLTDRFFERVMFPICDRFGNPIAFSGRLLPEAERAAKEAGRGVGKYVNNTDTPLYHKSNAVFNLHHARVAVRDAGRLIIMEGPTDVMAADQAGVKECVAVMGTALTPEHVRQLGTLVGGDGRLVILLDGDAAGQANSLKAVRTCLSVGVPVQVSVLPDQLDPAELLAESQAGSESRALFERVVDGGRADIHHLIETVAARPYELDAQGKLAAVDEVLAALRPMPDAELRALHLGNVAEWFGIDRARLEKRLAGTEAPPARAAETAPPDGAPPLPALEAAAEGTLHLLVRFPALRSTAFDDLALEPDWFPPPWQALAASLQLRADADLQTLIAEATTIHTGIHAAVVRWGTTALDARFRSGHAEPGVDEERTAAADLVRRVSELRIVRLRTDLLRLTRELTGAEKARDFVRVKQLFADRTALTRELKDLEGQSGA